MSTKRSARLGGTRVRTVDPLINVLPTQFPGIDRAACRRVDPELFFPRLSREGQFTRKQEPQIVAAKSVCGRCPVRAACLGAALAQGEHQGIWGGLTPAERRRIMRDIEALHRDVRRHVRRLTSGEHVALAPADAIPVVYRLRKDAAWTIDQVAGALGIHSASAYAIYRRALSAARASDALRSLSRSGHPAA